jgi:hypothetical protein
MENIMNWGRITTTIASASVIAALGLSLGLVGTAGASPTSPATATHAGSATAASHYVVLNCADKAQVKPGTIILACADHGLYLASLHWTSWTPELASAYGTEWQNDCKPDCADGHFHHYAVVAVLWGSAGVKGHSGERRYTEVTLSYPKARPPLYARSCSGKVVATHPVSQTVPLAP